MAETGQIDDEAAAEIVSRVSVMSETGVRISEMTDPAGRFGTGEIIALLLGVLLRVHQCVIFSEAAHRIGHHRLHVAAVHRGRALEKDVIIGRPALTISHI